MVAYIYQSLEKQTQQVGDARLETDTQNILTETEI